MQFLSMVTGFR